MQQSVRRIKKKGYSDVLVEMVKKVKYKQLYDGVMSKKAYCSLCVPDRFVLPANDGGQAFPLVLFLLSTIDEGCNIHLVQSRGLYA